MASVNKHSAEPTAAEIAYGDELLDLAKDLARNDAQMWDNLPQSARNYYIDEAREELNAD